MSWLNNLARRFADLSDQYEGSAPPATTGGGAIDHQSEVRGHSADRDIRRSPTGIDWGAVPSDLPSGPPKDPHRRTAPLLDVEQYIKGEWDGPFTAGGWGQLSVSDDVPMAGMGEIDYHGKESGQPGTYGTGRPAVSAVGAAQMGGAEAKRGLTFDPGPKNIRSQLDELRQQYQAAGGAGGAAGRPAPPPFRYDWARPEAPQFQRAEPFQFDDTDPLGAEVREARPRPAEYERDKQRYEKLLGS